LEVGGWKLEVGSWKLEGGSYWKKERSRAGRLERSEEDIEGRILKTEK
jgi:hypothetical protein